jgi:hypothetical protein
MEFAVVGGQSVVIIRRVYGNGDEIDAFARQLIFQVNAV